MAAKPFASSAEPGVTEQTLEVLADGVHALTAEGDPGPVLRRPAAGVRTAERDRAVGEQLRG